MNEGTTPVIVVGAGLSGLATALGCAERGRDVVVLETGDLVGGAAAYSGGQVWVAANHVMEREGIEDTLDLGERYVRSISHAHPELLDVAAMRRWLTIAPVATRHWEHLGDPMGDHPRTRGLPRHGRRSAGCGPLPHQ